MPLLQLLHSFGRNFLVYFAPIIFILFGLSINLPNATLHKQSFISNHFYTQFSNEVLKLKDSNQTIKQIIPNLNDNFASPLWLQNNTEIAINNFTSWSKGDIDVLPEINPLGLQAVTSNPSFTQLKNLNSQELKSYAKQFGLNPDDLTQKLATIQNQTALNPAANQGFNFLNFPNWIKTFLVLAHNFVPIFTILYVVMLLLIAGSSPLFGKSPLRESGVILWRVGLSTTISSLVFLSGLLITIYTSSFVQSSFLSIFNTSAITSLLQWQAFWLAFGVMSTAIYVGVASLAAGYVLNKV